ncbi:MAG: imidazolonepropionase [Bdellovibrionales bacterium]
MKIYKNIKTLYTFKGFAKKEGVKPVDKDFAPIKDAALVVNKGVVEWVGKEKDLPKDYKGKVYDLKGFNVYPSFTESHTHLVFGGDRKAEFEKKINGATYQEIQKSGGGISKTVKDTAKISLKDLIKVSQKRVNKFKKQGVSLLEVKSGYGQNLKNEMKQLEAAFSLKGVKIKPTYLALHSFKGDKLEYVHRVVNKDLPKVLERFPKLDRVDLFVEKGFFDLDDLKVLATKALGSELTFCVHSDQLSFCKSALGSAKLGALSVEHAVYLKDKEINEMSKYPTVVNLLPAADFYLDTKYPNARKLIDAGVRVSLATDYNPGSSPTQDLSFIGVLARRQMKMSLAEVWCAYTVNASRALGVFDKGSLIKGFSADFFTSENEPEDFFYEVGSHPVQKLYN